MATFRTVETAAGMVLVNVDLIREVRPAGEHTQLRFDEGHSVVVKGDWDEVSVLIKSAGI